MAPKPITSEILNRFTVNAAQYQHWLLNNILIMGVGVWSTSIKGHLIDAHPNIVKTIEVVRYRFQKPPLQSRPSYYFFIFHTN